MKTNHTGSLVTGGHSRTTMLLMALLAGFIIALLAALPAYAELSAVAPRTDATGYPAWYRDVNGVKLKLCVDSPNCLGGDPRPNRTKPATIKNGNLLDEAFYSVVDGDTELNDIDGDGEGGRIKWRAALEGAFGGTGVVKDGRQVVFTRVQVVGSKIDPDDYPADTVLTFVTPYGPMSSTITAQGTLKTRKESALGTAANGFSPPGVGPVDETRTGFGPLFLRWDPAVAPAAPAGFLGNGRTLHTITGGDGGVNTFQVFEGGAPASPLVRRFVVAGQCFRGTC